MLDNLHMMTVENEGRAGQLLNIGNLYNNMGDFKSAVKYHLQSLALFEKVNSKRGQSFALHSLGNDLVELKQFARAKTYLERSMKMKEELKDKRGMITTSMGMGDIYKQLDQHTLSEKYYLTSLQIAQEMNLPSEEARGNHQLGLLYKKMGDFVHAKETIAKGLAIARKTGDSTMSATINSQLVALTLEEGQENQLENTFFSNLNTFKYSGDRNGEVLEYFRLSEYYASRKQFDKAFFYLKKHEELTDSIEGAAVQLQIKHLEEQYEGEKKEKQIALLQKDQQVQKLELGRQQAYVIVIVIALISVIIISALLVNRYRVTNQTRRIVEMERMRNTIARDLHDDIGSTLSSINILSQLALQGNTSEWSRHFQRINEHSGKIMEKMSDIVWSINTNNDSLEQVISKMKEFAGEILEPKNILYHFEETEDVKNFALTIEKRKNIFLIFKEAINNAAKYSEGSDVAIRIWVQADKICFSINDNGKGFDTSLVKTGNGLKNMQARAANILGILRHVSHPGQGTNILLEVPIT